MGCSRIKEYSDKVAIGEEHTRHNWCAGSIFRNLHVVDVSSLDHSLLLLICLSRALSLSRWEASWLRTLSKKVTHFSTIETGVLGSLPLRWGRSSGIPLLLRGPIILRPLNILLSWSDHHLLLPRLLEERPGRCLICHSGALGSTSRRSSCDPGFLLFQILKTKVFLHGYSIIHQLIEILKTTAQARPKFWTHSFQEAFSLLCIGIHMVGGIAIQVIESLDVLVNSPTALLQSHKLVKLNLHDT